MTLMSYGEAVVDALYTSMKEDPTVTLIWGSLTGVGGQSPLVAKIKEEFSDRILHPPISEAGMAGIAAGAAMSGLRPILPFGTASFMLRAWDQIVHEAGSVHYMSNGKARAPIVFHGVHGLRGGGGPQHSLSPQAMLWNNPGIEIVLPSSPADARGLLRSAIRSNNPTVVLDHQRLTKVEGDVPEGDFIVPFGRADIKRVGKDITIVAASLQVKAAISAADELVSDGIDLEVIDLRSLVPLDEETILQSVAKTGRLIVADETPMRCSIASEVIVTVCEKGLDFLKSPPVRINRRHGHIPTNLAMEEHGLPSVQRIVAAAKSLAV